MDSPSFNKCTDSPCVQTNGSDIEITIGKQQSKVGDNRLWLHGIYSILDMDAKAVTSDFLQKALVITATSSNVNLTRNLLGEVVVFNDDEMSLDGHKVGYFNFDLTDWLNIYEDRKYYITVSIAKWLSNTAVVNMSAVK